MIFFLNKYWPIRSLLSSWKDHPDEIDYFVWPCIKVCSSMVSLKMFALHQQTTTKNTLVNSNRYYINVA